MTHLAITHTSPVITVAIPTRNRPRDLARCLESLQRVTYPTWHVFVIDQSDQCDERTTWLVARHYSRRMPSLRYIPMREKGLTRARNLALHITDGELLVFLDDDCSVQPNWLTEIASAFAEHPDVPLIFGQVRPAPHDSKQCFIPGHEITTERMLHGRLAFLRAGSLMGASMYLRPTVCRTVGPFDVHAGPGAEFNIEDRDYAYRILAAGYPVLLTPRISIEHYGARYYRDTATRALLRSYGYGFGAQDMKFLRCGDSLMLLIIVGHLLKMLGFIVWSRVLVGRIRGSHVTWIFMYLYGLVASLRVPVLAQLGLWGSLEEYEPDDVLPAHTATETQRTAAQRKPRPETLMMSTCIRAPGR